ncbi:hypothetical protein MG5_01133 [Candida albicans P57072]|uniref:Uncharacterized protein n=1 Tax=Candida albicans (strain SC5314 / ATCC MYA-2876) TaxID=237561 RepID=Q59TV1_CANAL|nr:uncharacterized protein CAALFM_C111740WA [Candida albicans SC5314]AOW26798.1 hypothetical protein CAALFM_C111740WA [Candida albicans SC5314]KGR14396.1 hypothetical protein MG5_01133 [Candida albicans P57072]KHC41174.1 hypothetical protein MGO_01128 [Candida albicans P76055]KHC41843.1 hypothetical protein MGQ_01133 [Candida albicans P76067]|eukprot:XP_713012.1 hypothetical protein CAALFM_C111740WA [Candida albicans SC5314]
MVSRSHSSTPVPIDADHPIHFLNIGNQDQIASLSKQTPIILLNQQEENGFQTPELVALRNSNKYVFVINWLYNYRGYLKLQSELFDIDLFELELLGFFNAFDLSSLFINKLKLALITSVQNSKLVELEDFEFVFRAHFGDDSPLGIQTDNEQDSVKFDLLNITEKFDILYILINYISKYSKFRDWTEKQGLTTRIDPIFKSSSAEYFSLFDDNRLYKRTITYYPLTIPKKRKLSPESPQDYFDSKVFDVKDVKFELVYKNIYEFNEYLSKIKKSSAHKLLYTKLAGKSSTIIDTIFDNEVKKRRYLINKRKEIQMVNLLAVRKRSSRLEAKERQRQEELERQREEESKQAAERRFERRMKLKNTENMDTGKLSRDQRMQLRQLNYEPTPEPDKA